MNIKGITALCDGESEIGQTVDAGFVFTPVYMPCKLSKRALGTLQGSINSPVPVLPFCFGFD